MSKGGNFEWIDCCDCMVLLFYYFIIFYCLAQMKEFIAKEEEEKKGFDCMVCKSKSLNAIGEKN